uniref:FIIND domain-containing protein n=1 Tax=Sparus aurata TaxID=8175 RepID=A0A671XAF3_SPAAU
MESTVEPRRRGRRASCFRRAASRIRRALSRICGDSSASSPDDGNTSIRSPPDDDDYLEVESQMLELTGSSFTEPDFEDCISLAEIYEDIDDFDEGNRLPFTASSTYSSGHALLCPDAFERLYQCPESWPSDIYDPLEEMEEPVTAVSSSVTNTQPTRPHLQLSSDPGWSQRGSSCLPRSHSVPSLSQISCAENKTFRPSQSLPDMLLKSSFEEFTPDITVDEDDESYRFLCSCPGLYQCSVTGLVFHMEGEGDVVYRIVSWDRRLLAQHHKKPAGPLFDIKCLQQSVD